MTFRVDGNEPPTSVELPTMGPRSRGTLHFESNMRTALVIKDGQLHRWSAAKPGVLGPGVPTPFSSMCEDRPPDGRSVMSIEGRLFDTGAWPPRPTGVRFAHTGWQDSEQQCACRNKAETGGSRHRGFSVMRAAAGSGGSPVPTAGPALARRIRTAAGTRRRVLQCPVRPARDDCGPLGDSAGVAYPAEPMPPMTSASWT